MGRTPPPFDTRSPHPRLQVARALEEVGKWPVLAQVRLRERPGGALHRHPPTVARRPARPGRGRRLVGNKLRMAGACVGEEVDGGGRHMQWWQVASRPQQTRGAEHETREPLTSVDRCVKQSAHPCAKRLRRWCARAHAVVPSHSGSHPISPHKRRSNGEHVRGRHHSQRATRHRRPPRQRRPRASSPA